MMHKVTSFLDQSSFNYEGGNRMRYEKKLNIEKRSREEALELLQQDV